MVKRKSGKSSGSSTVLLPQYHFISLQFPGSLLPNYFSALSGNSKTTWPGSSFVNVCNAINYRCKFGLGIHPLSGVVQDTMGIQNRSKMCLSFIIWVFPGSSESFISWPAHSLTKQLTKGQHRNNETLALMQN
uniref:Uncharacterized protein n=1 Tax=Sphaerodactylus townsendi TaxID=933632 RepID=A0ACB8EIL1_9SAUR